MKIEEVNKKIEQLERIKSFLEVPIEADSSMDTIIYKKYLEYENVSGVSRWLSENGYMKKSEDSTRLIKYNAADVSNSIKDKNVDVDEELKKIVKKLFKKHSRYY